MRSVCRKDNGMKKKIGLGILVFIELALVISIYLIGGRLAPWIWSALVFIISPVASVALLIQLAVGLVRALKKKSIKWNVCTALSRL